MWHTVWEWSPLHVTTLQYWIDYWWTSDNHNKSVGAPHCTVWQINFATTLLRPDADRIRRGAARHSVWWLEKFTSISAPIFICKDMDLVFRNSLNKRYGHTAHTFSRLLSDILIWQRFISISSRFQKTDNNSFLLISPADLIT